jgi:fluoroacetyl-CoA thioesterase
MSATLQPGLAHELRFVVPESKTVPALYPESEAFRQMPRVLATGFMVGLLEWACSEALEPHLDWPREQTVGTRVDVTHVAATPPGLTVTVRVKLVEVDGRRLRFDVEADDGVDLITSGHHERAVIDAERFARRVAAKAGTAGEDRRAAPRSG